MNDSIVCQELADEENCLPRRRSRHFARDDYEEEPSSDRFARMVQKIESVERNIAVTNAMLDCRLFPEHQLYCEGFEKPMFRGVLHLVVSLIIPFGAYVMVRSSGENETAVMCSILYSLSHFFCYGVSGLFHVFSWSVETEILLQKLDHCGIAILSVGTMIPTSLLLLPPAMGMFLLSVSILLCIVTCFKIFCLQPSLVYQALCAVWWIVPFAYPFLYLMTTPEFSFMIATIIFNALGLFVFVNKYPDPCPGVWGYHEVFHVFVVCAGSCIFSCNWSIVSRMSSVQEFS